MKYSNTFRSVKRYVGILTLGLACFFASTASYAGAYDDFFDAVKRDEPAKIKALVQKGFDPNTVESTRGENGLIVALREDSMKAFEFLLNTPSVDLNKRADNGDTALMIAAFRANQPAVKMLLAKGALVNQTGWTALHYAAASGSNEIVQLLLDRNANINALSPNKTTPIMMAAWNGHIYTVKLLSDKGADITLRNEQNMNVIDFALSNNHKDIAEGMQYRLNKLQNRKSQ